MATPLPLPSLPVGQTAKIHALHTDPHFQFRLNGLGFRIGKLIEIIRTAPFNGPLHVKLANTEVILRQQDAAKIEILG